MNEDQSNDADFESELRSLNPTNVRPETLQRWQDLCRHEDAEPIAAHESRGGILALWGNGLSIRHLLAAACVFLAGFLLLQFQKQPELPSGAVSSQPAPRNPIGGEPALFSELSFEPNALENHFVGARDDGVIGAVGGVPFRRVRFQLADTYLWENGEDGSRLEMVIPREEILLLPVVTY